MRQRRGRLERCVVPFEISESARLFERTARHLAGRTVAPASAVASRRAATSETMRQARASAGSRPCLDERLCDRVIPGPRHRPRPDCAQLSLAPSGGGRLRRSRLARMRRRARHNTFVPSDLVAQDALEVSAGLSRRHLTRHVVFMPRLNHGTVVSSSAADSIAAACIFVASSTESRRRRIDSPSSCVGTGLTFTIVGRPP
jgi:hypothetical protein